jgi:hypothetical protein
MVSMSGEMFRPCKTVSSAVLTIAVISLVFVDRTNPRKNRAAPTPPASTAITRVKRNEPN